MAAGPVAATRAVNGIRSLKKPKRKGLRPLISDAKKAALWSLWTWAVKRGMSPALSPALESWTA